MVILAVNQLLHFLSSVSILLIYHSAHSTAPPFEYQSICDLHFVTLVDFSGTAAMMGTRGQQQPWADNEFLKR